MRHLKSSGLLPKPRKRKTTNPTKAKVTKTQNPSQSNTTPTPPEPEKKKRETFKQTILAIVSTLETPFPREDLVTLAIERNKPKSARPEFVYNDIIRKLAKENKILLDKTGGVKKKNHAVFHL